MSRIYQHTLELLPQIKEMLAKGKTHKEIEDALGLVGDRPIHNLLKRERRKEKRGVSKPRGLKPAKTLQEYKYENNRLKMSCCGIFSRSQKVSENKCKIYGNLPS